MITNVATSQFLKFFFWQEGIKWHETIHLLETSQIFDNTILLNNANHYAKIALCNHFWVY